MERFASVPSQVGPAVPAGCRVRRASRVSAGTAGPTYYIPLVLAAILGAWALPARAQDTVYLAGSSDSAGYTKLTGTVVDYTGRELLLEMAGGARRSLPSEQVVRIDTPRTDRQVQADELFEQGDFSSALALYRQARDEERRRWVRREIVARTVWCYRALGDPRSAGENFLLLVQSDPETVDFDSIPLAWYGGPPSSAVERAARAWMARGEIPAAVLLGASHLLTTASGATALARLKQLSTSADANLAPLALAQSWRASVVSADEKTLQRWQAAVERMPRSLRAGPYYVVGFGWGRREKWARAALCWMRIPILYRHHRTLAARALVDAGVALEKLDRPGQSALLYREVLTDFADSPSLREAKTRLQQQADRPHG